jgi:opacity protein-like surface antigen
MKFLQSSVLLVCFWFMASSIDAQTAYKRFAAEPFGGISYPETDPTSKMTPCYGMGLRYTLSPLMAFSLGYTYGTWQNGKDLIGRTFKAYYYMVALRTQVNLGELFHFDQVTRKWHPYVSIGYGRLQAMVSGIRAREKQTKVARDFSGNMNAFPVGLGVRFYLSPRLDLGLNFEYLLHSSDSIDGHSLDMRLFNVKNNPDYAMFLTASLAYKFGTKKQKGNPHLDWFSPRHQEEERITNLYNDQNYARIELDSLKQVIRFMEMDIVRMDTMIRTLSGSRDSLMLTLESKINADRQRGSMLTVRQDALVRDTAVGSTEATIPSLSDSTMMDIVFRAFDSQATRTDSLVQALIELQDKMNFFLLGYTPKYGRVKVVTEIKLREMVPNTKARIIKVIPVGTTLEFTGYVSKGELIEGNPNWYKDEYGNYFWAGHTSNPWPEEK